MPYRNLATLTEWVAEFRSLGYQIDDSLRVIAQEGEDGSDTGLVALVLGGSTTSVYVQPTTVGSTRWCVTFEARDEAIEMSAAGVSGLSAELAVLAALCAFLEAKASALLSAP